MQLRLLCPPPADQGDQCTCLDCTEVRPVRWKDRLKIGSSIIHNSDTQGDIWVAAEHSWEFESGKDLLK